MTKEEYLQKQWDSLDKMPIEQLREYTKRLDASAQAYFHNWQETVQEVNRLQTIVQQSLSGLEDKSSSPKICPKCMGTGKWYMGQEDGEGFKCRKCNGHGQIF